MSEIKNNDDVLLLTELADHYKKLVMERECGMRNVLTRLQNLRSELEMTEERNPFGDRKFEYRIKTFNSAFEKLGRKGFEISKRGLDELHDIAGIRIIVPYSDDVDKVIDLIKKPLIVSKKKKLFKKEQEEKEALEVVEEKDYINSPKANGYRAYHMLTNMKCYFSNGEARWIPVEIQIMTKAMELWASYEHELRYKNPNPSPKAVKMLKEVSDQLTAYDEKLIELRDYEEVEEPAEEPEDEGGDLEMITLDGIDSVEAAEVNE